MTKTALAIIAHPNTASSFNAALLDCTKQACEQAGATLEINDLYKNCFDPIITTKDMAAAFNGSPAEDVKAEQEKVAGADILIFHYPVFWFDRPAILKGWFDRVLTNGFAFQIGENGVDGLLKGKKGAVVQTAGTPREFYQSLNAEDYPQAGIERGTLGFCGIDASTLTHYNVFQVTDTEREAMKTRTVEFIADHLS